MRSLRAVTLAIVLACAAAAGAPEGVAADPAPAAADKACSAALTVLDRCIAAGPTASGDVGHRCCALLESFTAHGCMW